MCAGSGRPLNLRGYLATLPNRSMSRHGVRAASRPTFVRSHPQAQCSLRREFCRTAV